ncbi:PD40 domain-containing protein [candidate division KSB1 bacterium]|nr:PD40 domain-containing protein [candidate division KSB1 bacterium]
MIGRRILLSILFCIIIVNHSLAFDQLVGARYPSLSPDADQIAFSYVGDIWTVSAGGGKADKLTNNLGYEYKPVWSPDGNFIAFTSDRNGNDDIFVISSNGGTPVQLTFNTSTDIASDFSPDGEWIYFRSSRSSSSGIFKIKTTGGNAVPLLDSYWAYPYDPKINPSNNSMIFSLGGENGSWWRKGYRGSNASKIWIKNFNSDEADIVIDETSNSHWPAWNVDASKIFYVSESQYNNKNIWMADTGGSGKNPVTTFRDGNVLWMSLARNKDIAVYERNFGIWVTDLNTGRSNAVNIESPVETKANSSFFVDNANVSEYSLAPDGKKIAAVIRGEIFVSSVEGGYARNVTNTSWRERDITWDKESKNIIYSSDVDANRNLYKVSAIGGEPVMLTNTVDDILNPVVSPDGNYIAYYRGHRQIRIMNTDGNNDRLLVEDDFGGRFASGYTWSPDSKYISYVAGSSHNDIYAVNVETNDILQLTDTAYDEENPYWAPDGKSLYFSSNRTGHSFPEFTGKWDIYKLDLKPEMPEFDEDDFEEMFEDEEKEDEDENKENEEEVTVEFQLEDINLQTTRITNTLGNDRNFLISPKDEDKLIFVSNIDGRNHLWQMDLENNNSRYTPYMGSLNNPSSLQPDESGKFIYYLSGGKIGRINLNSNKTEPVNFNTKIEVDRTADYVQMLGELYYTLQHYYYDENHHTLDWDETYGRFLPVLTQVREDKDFRDYANMMIGNLNSSHTGFRMPSTISTEKPSGYTGAVFDFTGNNITLKRIIKNSPLYIYRDKVAPGDELISLNGESVGTSENIWKALNGNSNKRLKMKFRKSDSGEEVEVSVKPGSGGAENRLKLEEWITGKRDQVTDKTGDDVAYLYMRAMGRGDLNRFLLELERDAVPRKGLILDLRWNNGGNVHDRVIDALTRPVYAKWKIRGLSETQQSTFGFADKPIIIITNERTLSDGEMVANGLKTLKRGPIVGTTTYGWLIFTTSVGLINGGNFRLPFWGCYTLDGENLETMGGVIPDISVANDLNNELNGTDPQLDRAIEEILKLIK